MLGLISALEGAGAAGGELGHMISSGMVAAQSGRMQDVSKQVDSVWKKNLPVKQAHAQSVGGVRRSETVATVAPSPPVQAVASSRAPAASPLHAPSQRVGSSVQPARVAPPAMSAKQKRLATFKRAKAMEAKIKEEDAAEAAKVSSLFKTFKASEDDDGLDGSGGSDDVSVAQLAKDAMGGTSMADIAAKVDAAGAHKAAMNQIHALAKKAAGGGDNVNLGDNLADLVNLMKQPAPTTIKQAFHPFNMASHSHLAKREEEVRACAALFSLLALLCSFHAGWPCQAPTRFLTKGAVLVGAEAAVR